MFETTEDSVVFIAPRMDKALGRLVLRRWERLCERNSLFVPRSVLICSWHCTAAALKVSDTNHCGPVETWDRFNTLVRPIKTSRTDADLNEIWMTWCCQTLRIHRIHFAVVIPLFAIRTASTTSSVTHAVGENRHLLLWPCFHFNIQ